MTATGHERDAADRSAHTPAVRVESLCGGYGESNVIRDVTFQVHRGEIFAILGKNGMGKSTLLKAMMGFLPRRQGYVELLGTDVTRWPPYLIARHGVGYVPQEKAIFQDLSVEENLRLAAVGLRRVKERLDLVSHWFPAVALRRRQRAGTLSGGEQKMLLVARALLAEPRLLLVDEISEGLQPALIGRLQEVLAEERQRGRLTTILVEQNVRFALALADRYAVLKLGTIVDSGPATAEARARIEHHLAAF
ncbi:MAG: ABC transporter ATP-binding protein [Armatimonadota bacterium]|nr:ABC transporter ATP-binding protein [Armatimonadota bacterium]